MSTNFYLIIPLEEKATSIHIGKSSMGHVFHFSDFNGEMNSYKDWKCFLSNFSEFIYDEYGEKRSLKGFLELVESKQKHGLTYEELAIKDPKNWNLERFDRFWRYDEDGYCIMEGEFS